MSLWEILLFKAVSQESHILCPCPGLEDFAARLVDTSLCLADGQL